MGRICSLRPKHVHCFSSWWWPWNTENGEVMEHPWADTKETHNDECRIEDIRNGREVLSPTSYRMSSEASWSCSAMTHSLLLLFVNASALGMSLYILGLLIYIYIYSTYFYKKVFDQSRSAAISTTSFQKELWKIYWKLRTCCCWIPFCVLSDYRR